MSTRYTITSKPHTQLSAKGNREIDAVAIELYCPRYTGLGAMTAGILYIADGDLRVSGTSHYNARTVEELHWYTQSLMLFTNFVNELQPVIEDYRAGLITLHVAVAALAKTQTVTV